MGRIGTTLIAAMIAGTLLASCGGDDGTAATTTVSTVAPAYDVIRPATLAPGDEIPAPTGDVVLTLTGAITNTNVGDTLVLDMDLLESLQLVEYTTPDDQAEGTDSTFRGVLLSDLVALSGATDATNLHTIALNDYAVDIPAADLEHAVMVATSVNGERMTVERYGPTRIVYPYATDDLEPAIYDPRWIWQLATIDIS